MAGPGAPLYSVPASTWLVGMPSVYIWIQSCQCQGSMRPISVSAVEGTEFGGVRAVKNEAPTAGTVQTPRTSFELSQPVTVKGIWTGSVIMEGPEQKRKGPYYVIVASREKVKEDRDYTFTLYPLYEYTDPLADVHYRYAYCD